MTYGSRNHGRLMSIWGRRRWRLVTHFCPTFRFRKARFCGFIVMGPFRDFPSYSFHGYAVDDR